jgi:hypothetical protein
MLLLESISNIELAKFINNVIVVLFLCGFLMSYKNWRFNSSIFIFSSFQLANITFASNVFNEFVLKIEEISVETFYLDMMRDDLITIIAIIFMHFILKVKINKITTIAISILLLNSFMYSFMHIDIVILQHKTAPFIWWDDFYTIFINTGEVVVASIIIAYSYANRKMKTLERCSNGI